MHPHPRIGNFAREREYAPCLNRAWRERKPPFETKEGSTARRFGAACLLGTLRTPESTERSGGFVVESASQGNLRRSVGFGRGCGRRSADCRRAGGSDLPRSRRSSTPASTTGKAPTARFVTGLRGKDVMDGRGRQRPPQRGAATTTPSRVAGTTSSAAGRSADKLFGGPGDDVLFGEEEKRHDLPRAGRRPRCRQRRRRQDYGWAEKGGVIIDDGVRPARWRLQRRHHRGGGEDTLLGFTHNDILSTKTRISPRRSWTAAATTTSSSLRARRQHARRRETGATSSTAPAATTSCSARATTDSSTDSSATMSSPAADGFDFLDGGPGTDVCAAASCATPPTVRTGSRDRAQRRNAGARARLLGPVAGD